MKRPITHLWSSKVTKWIVLVVWLIVAIGASGLSMKLAEVQNNSSEAWLPSDAEATAATAGLAAFEDPDNIMTGIVYESDGGLDPQALDSARADAEEFASVDGVVGKVVGPVVSEDGEAMSTMVVLNFGSNGWTEVPGAVSELKEIAEGTAEGVYITGPGGQAADSGEAFGDIDGTLLAATALVVVVLLLLTYRSPVLWILPLFSAFVALSVAQAAVYLAAQYGDVVVNGQSQGILTVLVFGAGTDYALLLVARYREELRRHQDRHQAVAVAVRRAGPAVIASAGTVVLSMLCLSFASLNSTAGLGPVAAIGVASGLLVMLTLLPALLAIFGRWIFWPLRPTFGSATRSGRWWTRLGEGISRRPRQVWIATVVVLGVAALGMLGWNGKGLAADETFTTETSSVIGMEVLAEHGLVDDTAPLEVIAPAEVANEVAEQIGSVPGVRLVADPVVQDDVALIVAPLVHDPASQAAFDTVGEVRDRVHAVDNRVLVGGGAAVAADIQEAAAADNWLMIPLVLVVIMLILMVLLRAVLEPLLLIATVGVSFLAALGLSTLLFQHVFGFESADASLPLLVFVFLVALGVDYNIFLVSRVREETAAHGTRRASVIALAATGGVITSAGLVLAGTFLVLATLPMVMFVQLGVAVALGILLDTFIVRSVLVTALNVDLGDLVWWPRSVRGRGEPEEDAAGVAQDDRVLGGVRG